jgi:sugar fermentation stimulation protein A
MQLDFKPTVAGCFTERLNRFVALVECSGKQVHAHIATSGRLWELLVPGATVLLEAVNDPLRKTQYNLRAVHHEGVWVSIDAQVPNKLLGKSFREGTLSPFAHCDYVRSEPAYGGGRFDFLLSDEGQPFYIEIKSVTLVENAVGLFPDAPTERGRRHLEHLGLAVGEGYRAAVIFVIQRSDAEYFAPNQRTDPAFARALRKASLAGVDVYAYRCRVRPAGIVLAERVAVMV